VPSIVIPCLKELDCLRTHQIDEAMLVGEASRPGSTQEVPQRFGLTDSPERISEDCFDDLQGSQSCLAVRLDPEAQIVQELALKDRLS